MLDHTRSLEQPDFVKVYVSKMLKIGLVSFFEGLFDAKIVKAEVVGLIAGWGCIIYTENA